VFLLKKGGAKMAKPNSESSETGVMTSDQGSKAQSCPHCGFPIDARNQATGWGCDRKPTCTNLECPSKQKKTKVGWGE
jgi:ssDNA-binding Zn-finger/Zn-ribbon topoisomerase 1